jgi:Zn-dependent membrane protease YugP
VPVVNFLSRLYLPLILVGAILGMATSLVSFGYFLTWAAIIMYGANTLFYLITLPIERDASNKALLILKETGDFSEDELRKAKNVLNAAIQTYV